MEKQKKPRSPTIRLRLTHAAVGRIPVPETRSVIVHDNPERGGVRALCVRVASTGTKTWLFYRRFHGQVVMMSLGQWPGLNAKEAVKLAQECTAAVSRGEDPRTARRKARGAKTFGVVFEQYLEEHARPFKTTWRENESLYRRYLKPWANRPLGSITRGEIGSLKDRIARTVNRLGNPNKTQANAVRLLLSSVFNKAIEWGYIETNPAQGLKLFTIEPRERFLQPEEMERFFRAVEEEPNRDVADLVMIALYTGQRRGNCLRMAWNHIDFGNAVWSIPGKEMKNRKTQTVPLVEPAIQILQRRRANGDGDRVFSIKDPVRAWRRIKARARIHDLRFHDLRRSLGSWAAGSGASLQIIGRALGHKSPGATAIYARLHLDPVRAAVDTAVAAMTKAANGVGQKEPARVVGMRPKKKGEA